MRRKILLVSGLFLLTAGSLFAGNPFASMAKANYAGYYTSGSISMIIMEFDGKFSGTVTREGKVLPFMGELQSGALTGKMGKDKNYSFTAKLNDDYLTFQSGTFKGTMKKKDGNIRSFADEFSSPKLVINLRSNGNNTYAGLMKLNGNTYGVQGKVSGSLFYGRFKAGGDFHTFTMMWDGEKVDFSSAGFSVQLSSKNIADAKEAKIKAKREAKEKAEQMKLKAEREAKEKAEQMRLAKLKAEREAERKKEEEFNRAPLRTDSYLSSLTDNGSSYCRNNIGMQFAYVAPGSFEMGSNSGDSNEEKPVHKVKITKPYLIGKYEVKQSEYEEIMGSNPSRFTGWFKGDNPVERVSWNDAVEFCRKLTAREHRNGNLRSGYAYRLPTEAQWEYAARGGSKSKGYTYSGSDSINSVAWYDNEVDKTHPVGQKSSNELGLYDMSGNVWEWCRDWYGDYPSGSVVDPAGPSSGSGRVNRGGGYWSDASGCRVAYRSTCTPGNTLDNLGFRVVLARE